MCVLYDMMIEWAFNLSLITLVLSRK